MIYKLSLVLILTTFPFLVTSGKERGEWRLRGLRKPTNKFRYCDAVSPPVRLFTLEEVERNKTSCNIVFYDRVYYMDEFIPIHKGGAWPIERNCGTDSTWLFENLQCISMVPDHFEGMLNMCSNYIVGVIEDSPEDPCSGGGSWTPPEHEYPDFEACHVYDNITCADLAAYTPKNLLDVPTTGLWTLTDVANAQSHSTVDMATNYTAHCFTALNGWVFDFAVSPLDGSAPFYLKHGNGWYPQAILRHCGKDMTANYTQTVDKDQECVPDHTLGGMNVLSGYVVGAIDGHVSSPCTTAPPDACQRFTASTLRTYTEDEVSALNVGCPVIVLGKVYDLEEFAEFHHGGSGQILGKCGRDISVQWLKKDFHNPLIHLGSIQRFQIGVIEHSINDPCDPATYDPELDF